MSNPLSKRLHYDLVKNYYNDPNQIISESNLTLVQPLTAAATNYTFDVLTNEGAPLSYESRLSPSDVFWASGMSFYVTPAGAAADDPEIIWLTFPSETELTATYLDWYNLYAGTFSITVNNVVYIQNLSAKQFQYIPQTQRLSIAVNQNYDEVNFATDAMFDFVPGIQLSGSHKNLVQLTAPAAVTGAVGNEVLIVQFHGLVAINASTFKSI